MNFFSFKFGRMAYGIDLAVYLVAPIIAVATAFYFSEERHALATVVAALLGFAGWTLLEYVLHRFVLHRFEPFKSWHGEHHVDPTATVGTPTFISLLLIALVIFLPAILLAGWQLGGGFSVGVLIGYSIYTWLHHGEHHWRSQNAWFRKLKRAHAIHHYGHNDCNYGVVTLFWDRLFGTYRQK